MRVLLVSMAAMAETSGPASRCRLLAEGLRDAEIEAATCLAKDVNYRETEGIPNYYLDVPMPLGLPKAIASRTFPAAQKLGITARKTVDSFDQVLHFTGNLDYRYLKKSVASVQNAIRAFQPDVVYSEFNLSAIIAAKKENIPLYATVSYPTRHEYAHQTNLAGGLNRLLNEMMLPQVDSALRLFDWAEKAFCPSIRELEPIEKPGIFYCGALKASKEKETDLPDRNKILVYMGNGTISAAKAFSTVREAFENSGYGVYIASSYLEEGTRGNIHVAPRWDFDKLLDEALLFIHHGGQNSMVDGLLHGVPQIAVPGKVFERKYNAECIVKNRAGKALSHRDFRADHLRAAAEEIIRTEEMAVNAGKLGRKLADAGGIRVIIDEF